jgi:hypothetical protein
MAKISVENQAFLKRLQDKPATYSVTKWNHEYRKAERIRQNLMEYPLSTKSQN